MTYNGILRTTNFNVEYEDAKRSDAASNVSSDAQHRPEQEWNGQGQSQST